MSLDKPYNPAEIEQRWYQHWEQQGYFAPAARADARPPYCIMIPPPNVTGSLHMGHAFQDTIMDALTRYHRMRGHNTLWQPGIDHAGIATQMVVERLINADGHTRQDYGRERFIEKIWQWKAQSGGMISQQLRRLGASPDWANERFTMDAGLSAAVTQVFVQLYEQGLIYRGKRLVNWDPKLHTALSDLEVLSQEETGQLWYLRYPLVDATVEGKPYLLVATTRPETVLGDSAVAVHPEDARYAHLVGGFVELPPTGRRIPIIADTYVDPAFGSGCVKITPAHDFNDYQVWLRQRHLEVMQAQIHTGLINIFTPDATIRANINHAELHEGELIPSAYIGLDRYAARKRIVADFTAAGLLERVATHKFTLPRGDRSGVVVEPWLTDQWYVDLTREVQPDGRAGGKVQITQPAIDAVENGSIEFIPANWRKTYYQWLENIEDWCISRQIWWGHRIPAWYDDNDNIYVGASLAEVRAKYQLPQRVELRQDADVLDTWFSSALWPFSTLGWPQQTARLKTFYPTSVLVTGFDIIFFWVARMIMFGTKFMHAVPFKQVYIHGLVRDAQGQKMSKSKGNVLDPIDLIDGIELDALLEKRTAGLMQPHLAEKIRQQTRQDYAKGIPSFGADALRFTFAALATNGRDINFDLARTEGYRNFCNKLWNAARFVIMHTQQDHAPPRGEVVRSTADKWILSRLQRSTAAVATAIEHYRFDHAAKAIYELVWNNYCDWYVEWCKPILNQPDHPLAAGTRQTLVQVLEAILRLAHPIMPFITEELWQLLAPLAGKQATGEQATGAQMTGKPRATIMLQPYPEAAPALIDAAAEQEMQWLMDLVLAIRKLRGEVKVAPSKQVTVLITHATATEQHRLNTHLAILLSISRAESIRVQPADQALPETATTMLGRTGVHLVLAGLIDLEQERKRLDKAIDKLRAEQTHLETKLANAGFIANAPKPVVQKQQQRLDDIRLSLAEYGAQREQLGS